MVRAFRRIVESTTKLTFPVLKTTWAMVLPAGFAENEILWVLFYIPKFYFA